ncbi:MAG: branched-chain amino acid ABC transporter permease [Ilumatobacteraceae bacterium]|nr:branched-chain amino acid ABC transporter permease [Ilumatobacteraceae bacterium]
MSELFRYLIAGIAVGSIYGLVALGFVLVFKATSVLNFAQGEFLMLAAYLAVTAAVTNSFGLAVSLLFVVLALSIVGVVMHFGVTKKLIGEPPFTLILVTIGVAIVIRGGLLMFYGPLERSSVDLLPAGGFTIGDVPVTWIDVIMFTVAVVCSAAFFAFFRWTTMGLKMRATAENLEAAKVVGIRPGQVFLMAWVIAAFVAGIAGFFYANRVAVVSLSLSAIGLRAFPAAMLGGITSVEGALIGGIIVGVVEQVGAGYLGGEWRDVFAFSIMLLVLLIRPSGLFGDKELVRV